MALDIGVNAVLSQIGLDAIKTIGHVQPPCVLVNVVWILQESGQSC
jgi:hypothetical protein